MSVLTPSNENEQVAIEHRLAVMKIGRTIWIMIVALVVWGVYSSKYFLILVAPIAGWAAMLVISIQAANKVKKLTGLSHFEQTALWTLYKVNIKIDKYDD